MTSWGSIEKGIARHNPAVEFRLALQSAPSVQLGAMYNLQVAEAGDFAAQSLPSSGGQNIPER
jgi:hypothetical protein